MEKKATAKVVVSRWEPLPENALTMQVMVIPEVDERPFRFEGKTKEDLINLSKYIEQSNKTLETENIVIERYLNRADPNALEKMNQTLEAAAAALKKIEKLTHLGGAPSTLSVKKEITDSKSTFYSSSESPQIGTVKSESTQRGLIGLNNKKVMVQPLQKIEIVNREIDELKGILENFRKKAKNFNYLLKCREEEMSERLAEITQAQFAFDHKLLVEDLDPMTGTLPGEKFLRFMEKRLRQEEVEVKRLGIKTGCLKNHLKKVKAELSQKKEMAEEFDTIDFEVLRVENQQCQKVLDEKVFNLSHLKKSNGRFESLFNHDKQKLEEQMVILSELQEIIESKNKLIEGLQKSEESLDSDITAATYSLEKIKWLNKSFTAPEVMDYIYKKVELHKLQKDIKVKKRKIKLKKLMLSQQARNKKRRSLELLKLALGGFSSANLRDSVMNF